MLAQKLLPFLVAGTLHMWNPGSTGVMVQHGKNQTWLVPGARVSKPQVDVGKSAPLQFLNGDAKVWVEMDNVRFEPLDVGYEWRVPSGAGMAMLLTSADQKAILTFQQAGVRSWSAELFENRSVGVFIYWLMGPVPEGTLTVVSTAPITVHAVECPEDGRPCAVVPSERVR